MILVYTIYLPLDPKRHIPILKDIDANKIYVTAFRKNSNVKLEISCCPQSSGIQLSHDL